jgi:hypothetical protein
MDQCLKCGKEPIQDHHVIPSSIDPKSIERINLCKHCHDILHKLLLGVVWPYISKEQQGNAKFAIQQFTVWYVKKFEFKK